uniref:Uncharacterized protein n=1 Tax=Rhizophora mucronata TaxID=61149 RepID=A0A2P2PF71_RHIMU
MSLPTVFYSNLLHLYYCLSVVWLEIEREGSFL